MDFRTAKPIDQITAVFDGTVLETVRRHPLVGNINPYYEDLKHYSRVNRAIVASRILSTLYDPPQTDTYGTHANGVPFTTYLNRLPQEFINVLDLQDSSKLAYDAKLLVKKPGDEAGTYRYELSRNGEKMVETYGADKSDNTLSARKTDGLGCLALAGFFIGGPFLVRHVGVNFDEQWQWAREILNTTPGEDLSELLQGYLVGSTALAGTVVSVEKLGALRRAKAAYRQYEAYRAAE